VNARRNPFTKNCLPSMKGVVLPRLNSGGSGIYEQHVISTKWTKWTHGEIPLQKIVSLLWNEVKPSPFFDWKESRSIGKRRGFGGGFKIGWKFKPQVGDYRLLTIDYWLTTNIYRLLTIDYRLISDLLPIYI